MGLTSWLLDIAVLFIDKVGYLGIGFVLILDNAGVPIPSEGVLGLSGVASSTGLYNVVVLMILGSIAQTIGAALSYYIGLRGGERLVKRYGKFILISSHDYDTAKKWFAKRGARAIFISRLTPVVRTFTGFIAGAAQMEFRSFIVQSFLGSVVWTILWVSCGYLLGESWHRYYHYLHYVDYAIILAVVTFLMRYLWKRRDRLKRLFRGSS